jgi:hypothetical protein
LQKKNAALILLVYSIAYLFSLKKEVVRSLETSVIFYGFTRRYIPEEKILENILVWNSRHCYVQWQSWCWLNLVWIRTDEVLESWNESLESLHLETILLSSAKTKKKKKLNSVAWVRERTVPTERPQLVGEVSANFCGYRVSHGQRDGSPTAVISVFLTGAATISSKWLLNCTHKAEWTPFQILYFSENLVAPGIEPGPLDLSPGTLTTIPQRRSRCGSKELGKKHKIFLVHYEHRRLKPSFIIYFITNKNFVNCCETEGIIIYR